MGDFFAMGLGAFFSRKQIQDLFPPVAQGPRKGNMDQVILGATLDFDFVVGDAMMYCVYHEMRFSCATRCDFVLRDTIQYCKILVCITRYDYESVLRDTIQSYEVRFCTTRYDSVLRDKILFYGIRFCAAR